MSRAEQVANSLAMNALKKICLAFALLLASIPVLAGAWGEGSFENDDALDWVAQCIAARDASAVKAALEAPLTSAYIEASDGAIAVAAAEVVAAARGKPAKSLPKDLRAWLDRQPKATIAQLAPLAMRALARIKDPKVSELRQLWSEGKPNAWPRQVADLELRLSGQVAAK